MPTVVLQCSKKKQHFSTLSVGTQVSVVRVVFTSSPSCCGLIILVLRWSYDHFYDTHLSCCWLSAAPLFFGGIRGNHSLSSRSKILWHIKLLNIRLRRFTWCSAPEELMCLPTVPVLLVGSLKWDMVALQRLSTVCNSSRCAKLQENHGNGVKPLFMACLTNASGDATNVNMRQILSFLFPENSCCIYTFCSSSPPQGENPIYKSAVTTVVNPKYEGKWWSFTLTTLYGTVCGINGAGFLMLSLFVVATKL